MNDIKKIVNSLTVPMREALILQHYEEFETGVGTWMKLRKAGLINENFNVTELGLQVLRYMAEQKPTPVNVAAAGTWTGPDGPYGPHDKITIIDQDAKGGTPPFRAALAAVAHADAPEDCDHEWNVSSATITNADCKINICCKKCGLPQDEA